MKKSEKLGLWLPEGSDPLEVSKLSENFETLDPLGSGVEILKEGSGVGGLFMVSKYYDQPIKNAVLCNGGTLDSAAYPELSEFLGFYYGGSISFESISSTYGIPSNVYPMAYNKKHDCFIAMTNAYSITLYKKGGANESIAWNNAGTYQISAGYGCVTYDDTAVVIAGYSRSGLTTQYAGNVTIDLVEKKATINASTGLSSVTSTLATLYEDETFIGVSYELAFKTGAQKQSRFYMRSSGTNPISFIYNYDDQNKSALYALAYIDSSLKLIRFDKAPFIAYVKQKITEMGGLAASYSIPIFDYTVLGTVGSNNFGSGMFSFILNGHFYCIDSGKIIRGLCDGSSLGSVTTTTGTFCANIPHRINTDTTMIAPRYSVQPSNPSNAVTSSKNTTVIFKDTILSSTSVYPEYITTPLSYYFPYICTIRGVMANPTVSAQKLPTITQTESLVYMRTKGA